MRLWFSPCQQGFTSLELRGYPHLNISIGRVVTMFGVWGTTKPLEELLIFLICKDNF